jgi:uncharacterized protein YuzE
VKLEPSEHAIYLHLSGAAGCRRVSRTVSTSDLVLVDLDAHGTVLGVEVLVPAQDVTEGMLTSLAARFPEAARALRAALG